VAVALGKLGLAVAIVGTFAATFGATLETLLATGSDVAQYFGLSYGKVQPPVRASRFTTVTLVLLLGSTALALTTIDPITVTIVAVVFSASLLPYLFLPVLLVGNDRELMGELANGRLSNAVGMATIAISVALREFFRGFSRASPSADAQGEIDEIAQALVRQTVVDEAPGAAVAHEAACTELPERVGDRVLPRVDRKRDVADAHLLAGGERRGDARTNRIGEEAQGPRDLF